MWLVFGGVVMKEIRKLNKQETKFKNDFRIMHSKRCPDMKLVVKQGSPGIAFRTVVKCLVCRARCDVTDYGCW